MVEILPLAFVAKKADERHVADGGDWRGVIDAIRPFSHRLWHELPQSSKRSFLEHARAWWDVHRSRIAPQIAKTIAGLIGEGRLTVVAGRIVTAHDTGEALEVEIRRRGANAPQTMRFACAFNCTGPLRWELAREKRGLRPAGQSLVVLRNQG